MQITTELFYQWIHKSARVSSPQWVLHIFVRIAFESILVNGHKSINFSSIELVMWKSENHHDQWIPLAWSPEELFDRKCAISHEQCSFVVLRHMIMWKPGSLSFVYTKRKNCRKKIWKRTVWDICFPVAVNKGEDFQLKEHSPGHKPVPVMVQCICTSKTSLFYFQVDHHIRE